MKKIMPIEIQFKLLQQPESERHIQTAFNRIFIIAKENLIRKQITKEVKEKGGADKKAN